VLRPHAASRQDRWTMDVTECGEIGTARPRRKRTRNMYRWRGNGKSSGTGGRWLRSTVSRSSRPIRQTGSHRKNTSPSLVLNSVRGRNNDWIKHQHRFRLTSIAAFVRPAVMSIPIRTPGAEINPSSYRCVRIPEYRISYGNSLFECVEILEKTAQVRPVYPHSGR